MKNRKLLIVFLVAVMLLMVLMVPIIPAVASDNDKLALLLARTCVAEIGLHEESTVAECELMWQVNRRKALINNRTIGKQTRLFNSFWKVRKQRARRPYIMTMNGPEKPRGWPRGMRWDRYVDKWLTYRRAAIAFVRNPEQTTYICPEAIDYGAPNEIPKTNRLDVISCLGGKTRQWYWARRGN